MCQSISDPLSPVCLIFIPWPALRVGLRQNSAGLCQLPPCSPLKTEKSWPCLCYAGWWPQFNTVERQTVTLWWRVAVCVQSSLYTHHDKCNCTWSHTVAANWIHNEREFTCMTFWTPPPFSEEQQKLWYLKRCTILSNRTIKMSIACSKCSLF